jgi:hypothetical protein
MAMETVTEAIQRLRRAGYLDEYGADRKGLKSQGRNRVFSPETFHVDEIVRFEGESDPGDESAIFALTSEDGTKGTYTVAFGPLMDALDVEVVRKLGHA